MGAYMRYLFEKCNEPEVKKDTRGLKRCLERYFLGSQKMDAKKDASDEAK
jgi:hypothetical protein